MSDQLKESLSAIVDNEADDFELRRVLDEIGQDDEMRQKWSRYHLVSSILRSDGHSAAAASTLWGVIDDDAVASAPMDPEDVAVAETASRSGRSWVGGLVGAGVAATMTMAVVAFFGEGSDSPQLADNQTTPSATTTGVSGPNDLDVRRANAYMIQHSQHVSMKNRATIPFVKMVTHSTVGDIRRGNSAAD